MREKGLKQVDLANALDMMPNKISKTLAGERQIKVHEMDMLRSLLSEDDQGGVEGRATRKIPIVGGVPGGNWKEAVQRPIGTLNAPEDTPPNALALRVEGDSMDKVAPDGSDVIFDPDDRALYPGNMYIIINEGGETTFKKFMADPARLVPCSNNPRHTDLLIGEEAFQIVGAVIGVYTNYRRQR